MDLFQFGINLRLRKSNKTTTTLGKIMTIGIFTLIFYIFLSSDFYNKTNPIVMAQEVEVTARPLIALDKNNFTLIFAISDEYGNNYKPDPTYFSIEIFNYYYESNNSVYNLISKGEKAYHICNKTDFSRFPDLLKLGLNNTICLDDKNIKLEGYWDEKKLSYLYMGVLPCKNSTSNNLICKSKKQIADFFFMKYLTIWIERKNIDIIDYENPIKSLIKNYYKVIDINFSKSIYYFLQNAKIETEEYFSLNNYETYTNSKIDVDSFDSLNSDIIISFLIYSDDKIRKISRKYQTLQNLMANIGGIANILLVIGTAIAKIQNSLNIKNVIINELYLYPDLKKKKNESIKKKKKNETINKSKINFFTFSHSDNSIQLSNDTKTNLNKKQIQYAKNLRNMEDFEVFSKAKDKKHKYFFGFIHYCILFFKRKKNLSEKEKLFRKGEEFYYKDVDIVEISKRIKEIEKLKYILLDPTQRFLFNLLSKPMLNISNNKTEIPSVTNFNMDCSITPQTVKMNYNNLLMKKNKNEVDNRIINLLDKSIDNFINLNNNEI